MRLLEYSVTFTLGAVLYTLIEIAWRGHTHWTMTVTGGVCLCVLYLMSGVMSDAPLPLKWLAGAVAITLIELVVGCIVNLGLKQGVWDYSGVRLNLLGQICLPYSLMWYVLCIPGFFVCGMIKSVLSLLTGAEAG